MNEMKQDPNPISRLTRASLYSFIAFLSVSALFAITTVLSGEFGKFEIKVLVTTSVIAVASICSLCCSAYSRRAQHSLPGVGGISLALASAAMLILGVWTEMDSDGYWKTTAVLGVFAIAFAHALALLAVRLPTTHRWLQIGTTINIFVLAAVIAIMIIGELDDEGAFKLVAVLAILAALETLVIPILGRLTKAERGQEKETLSLTKRENGLYEDKQGLLYEVKRMSNKSPAGDA